MNNPTSYDLSQEHVVEACVRRNDMAEWIEFCDNGMNLLTFAVRLNRLDLVAQLLERGFPVDLNNVGLISTALSHAAYLGNIPAIQLLFTHGASIQGHENQDESPLHEAARAGNLDTVKELIRLGAKLDALGIHGETVLDVARGVDVTEFLKTAVSLKR